MNRWAVAARSAHIFTVVLVSAAQVTAFAAPIDTSADRIFGNAFELPPVAAFDQNALGFEVTFADQSSDPAGTVGAWPWDFGDGSTSTDQNPVHTFSAAGTYTVSETVFDANGQTGVLSKSVIVVPCGTLTSYLHDFNYYNTPGGHPDFNRYAGAVTGLVSSTITPGGLPAFQMSGGVITDAASFAQWFVDDPINYPIQQTLTLAEGPTGTYSFSTNTYYPIDGEGFNDQTDFDCSDSSHAHTHNFSFTTMLHTQFKYNGGENFSFTGDDDFWLYIDGHLVIDLGGIHGALTGTVTLTAAEAAVIGLSPGRIYRVDIFQAQRHTCASDFTLRTTACLSDAH